MHVKSVTIKNYGSYYGEHRIDLQDRGLVLVEGDTDEPMADSNGAGKSTPFEAIEWCWFGTVPKGDDADSIVNEDAGQDCIVETYLVDETGREALIRRGRKVGGKSKGGVLQLIFGLHDGGDQTALDMSETQQKIEAFLGLDHDTFRAAVLFSQFDRFNFAEATNAKRVELLTRILQLEEIDELLEQAKAWKKEVGTKNVEAEQQRKLLEQSVKADADLLQFLEKQEAGWEQERAGKLAAIEQSMQEQIAYRAQLQDQLDSLPGLRQELADLQANRPQPSPEIAEVSNKRDAIVASIVQAETEANMFSQRSLALYAEAEELGKLSNTVCPTCRQKVNAASIQAMQEQMRAEAQGVEGSAATKRAVAASMKQERDSIEAYLAELNRAHTDAVSRHAAQLSTLQHTIYGAEQAVQYDRKAADQELQLGRQLDDLRAQSNPVGQQRAETQQRVDDNRMALAHIDQETKASIEEEKRLDFWIEALGPKELKNYIFDSRLDEMNQLVNDWVQLLTGGAVWVQFATQSATKKKKLVNDVNIRVFKYKRDGSVVERGYKSSSGGERQKVALGIDFGLAAMVARRATKQYNLLILDELYRHLDRTAKQGVVGMLHRLRRDKDSVFVIEHDADFADAFEVRMTAKKTNDRSYIVEGEQHAEEAREEGLQGGGPPAHADEKPPVKKKRRRVPVDAALLGEAGATRSKPPGA